MADIIKRAGDIFGYNTLHEFQIQTIVALQNKNNVLLNVPTGSGKSLCYQIFPLLTKVKKTCIVVSPLISLMEDQQIKLELYDISNICLNSTCEKTPKEVKIELEKTPNKYTIIFTTPEYLNKHRQWIFQSLKTSLCLVAFDEAQCICQWGYNFRPEYREVDYIIDECPDIPLLLLSATITPDIQKDILSTLRITDRTKCIQLSIVRPNLHIKICHKGTTPMSDIVKIIDITKSTIIFVPTKHEAESIGHQLKKRFPHEILIYHSGIKQKRRKQIHRAFSCNYCIFYGN